MRILLVAVGERMPGWISDGYQEYARRMPHECRLELVEVPTAKRVKSAPMARIKMEEGERQLAAVPTGSTVVALDERGAPWSTRELANRLDGWLHSGSDIALLVGGPDGLSDACSAAATLRWSLSPLTLPHPLVRVLIAEQLYRAWSLLNNHPYHRD